MEALDRMKAVAATENLRMLAGMDHPSSKMQGEHGNESLLAILQRPHTTADLQHKFNLSAGHLRYRLNKLVSEGRVTVEVVESLRIYQKAEVADATA